MPATISKGKITSQRRTCLRHVSTQAPMYQRIGYTPEDPPLWYVFVMPKMCETSISNCVPRLSASRSRWSRTTSSGNRCTSGESTHLPSAAAGEDGDYFRNQRPHQLTHMAECVNYIRRNTPTWHASETEISSPHQNPKIKRS